MSIGCLDYGAFDVVLGHTPPSYWDHMEFFGLVYTALVEMVGHALIFWGFIMFMPDAILGHIPLVIRTI